MVILSCYMMGSKVALSSFANAQTVMRLSGHVCRLSGHVGGLSGHVGGLSGHVGRLSGHVGRLSTPLQLRSFTHPLRSEQ